MDGCVNGLWCDLGELTLFQWRAEESLNFVKIQLWIKLGFFWQENDQIDTETSAGSAFKLTSVDL